MNEETYYIVRLDRTSFSRDILLNSHVIIEQTGNNLKVLKSRMSSASDPIQDKDDVLNLLLDNPKELNFKAEESNE